MRNTWIWMGVGLAAVVFGLGAALGVSRVIATNGTGWGPGGMMQGWFQQQATPNAQPGWNNGPGMMNPGFGGAPVAQPNTTGQRLSIDQAVDRAKQYVASYSSGLQVSHIMEFSENFYVVVEETNTGRGAFELLVDPVSGAVFPEYGPNMMWNTKYGMMGGGMMGGGWGNSGDNTVRLDQAIQAGHKYLDANQPGAKLETDGVDFYGYYTFDYMGADGKIAGMLSVNGYNSAIWVHTWHGQFIQEKDLK